MSEIRSNTVSNAAGTGPATLTGQYAAKALASYNHATTTLNSSFNVSSATDIAAGQCSIAYTSALASASDNVVQVSANGLAVTTVASQDRTFALVRDKLTTGVSMRNNQDGSGIANDAAYTEFSVWGDLA